MYVQEQDAGPKGEEVTGDWRKFPDVELYDRLSSPNIFRTIESKSI
jgi:hypothetical protein